MIIVASEGLADPEKFCRIAEIAINLIASKSVDASDSHKVTITFPKDREEYDSIQVEIAIIYFSSGPNGGWIKTANNGYNLLFEHEDNGSVVPDAPMNLVKDSAS